MFEHKSESTLIQNLVEIIQIEYDFDSVSTVNPFAESGDVRRALNSLSFPHIKHEFNPFQVFVGRDCLDCEKIARFLSDLDLLAVPSCYQVPLL